MDINGNLFIQTVKTITKRYPAIVPHLRGRARWVAYAYKNPGWFHVRVATLPKCDIYFPVTALNEGKTVDFYIRTMQGLIRSVYNGDIGGQFIDIMANLIQGQLTQAYHNGAQDAGLSAEEMTPKMTAQLEQFILAEFDYVDNIFRDIVDARINETPIEPLLNRAKLWANRWNEVFNAAKVAVAAEFGLRLIWVLGPTEHCDTCIGADGIVAFATEWEEANIKPQGKMLECGGWRCQCELIPTNVRRSNNPAARLESLPRA